MTDAFFPRSGINKAYSYSLLLLNIVLKVLLTTIRKIDVIIVKIGKKDVKLLFLNDWIIYVDILIDSM